MVPDSGDSRPPAGAQAKDAREDIEHQQGKPEAGNGHAADRHAAEDLIGRLVAEHGRQHAEQDPQDNGNEHGENRKLHRRGEILQQILQHRPAGADRGAKIAVQQVFQVDKILLIQRLVQPPFRLEGRDNLGVVLGGCAQIGADRVAGHQVGDEEYHQRDAEQEKHHESQAPCYIPNQRGRTSFPGWRWLSRRRAVYRLPLLHPAPPGRGCKSGRSPEALQKYALAAPPILLKAICAVRPRSALPVGFCRDRYRRHFAACCSSA